jgi:bifunctional non-homologous end joining protein LigD
MVDKYKMRLADFQHKLLTAVCSASNSNSHGTNLDHSRGNGTALYRLACQLDLEGIVAKRADSRYENDPNKRNWIKIKNPSYSQKEGRGDLFRRAG